VTAYVTNGSGVTPINTATNKAGKAITVGASGAIAIAPSLAPALLNVPQGALIDPEGRRPRRHAGTSTLLDRRPAEMWFDEPDAELDAFRAFAPSHLLAQELTRSGGKTADNED
jgi:hypothetical protein